MNSFEGSRPTFHEDPSLSFPLQDLPKAGWVRTEGARKRSTFGSFQGWLWKAGAEDERLPGTVSLDANGVHIEVLGRFQWQASEEENPVPANLLGDFMDVGPVTCWKCHYSPVRSYQANESASEMEISRYLVTYAFIGVHIDLLVDGSEPLWTSIVLGVSHLQEWVGQTGIESSSDLDSITVTYQEPAALSWSFQDVEFAIRFGHTWSPARYEPQLHESIAVVLSSTTGRTITDWMLDIVVPYMDFQTLGMGVPCELTSLEVMYPRQFGDRYMDYPYSVAMYPWRRGAELPPVWYFSHRHFSFDPREQGFPQQFAHWFEAYETIADVIHLYMLSRYKADSLPFAEAGFLYAVQACESFHTAVYPSKAMSKNQADQVRRQARDLFEGDVKRRVNEKLFGLEWLTLMERLAELFDDHKELLIPKFDNLQELATQAKTTRNYYSHFTQSLASRKMDIGQTLDAANALWCVMCAALMEYIGFPRSAAHDAIKRTWEYRDIKDRHVL